MPEKADGSIIISAEVDDKRAQSHLNALEKKVKKLQNSIEDMQSRRSPLAEQMQVYGAELDKAKAKLAELKYMQEQDAEVLSGKMQGSFSDSYDEYMRAYERQSTLAADIERQEKEVAKLEKMWADVSKQVGRKSSLHKSKSNAPPRKRPKSRKEQTRPHRPRRTWRKLRKRPRVGFRVF